MNRQPRKTTLKDVARVCDVSPMTVSKMLNGKGGVSKETAARIWKAVRQLNYTPNLVAKSLRVNQTRTLGVVTSDSSELLFSKMIKGIIDAASAADYSVIIANTNQSRERESDSIRVLLNKRIDGILLAAPFRIDAELMDEITGFGVPVVLLMRASALPVDCVTSDNYRGGYDIIRYLAEKGAREFRFLSLPREHQNGAERLRGWRQAFLDLGWEFPEDRLYFMTPEFSESYAVMGRVLSEGPVRGAVVCGCDVIAVGAVKACLDAGTRVPGDVMVSGFDDIEMLDFLNVPLTTMRQQVYAMGREGVRLLLARMEHWDAPPAQLRLPCELVMRKSC